MLNYSPKQRLAIKQSLADGSFFTLLSGAIRSGKSFSAVVAFVVYTQAIGGSKINIIAGRNLRVMQVGLIADIIEFAKSLGCSAKYQATSGMVYIDNVSYLVVAGHDENSYKRIQSMTAGTAIVDEVQLVPESFLNQVISRLSFAESKLIATCNPEGRGHWLKKKFIDVEKADVIEFQLDDNPALSDTVKERYKELFSGVFYERNILGKWVQAEGVVYRNYQVGKFDVSEPDFIDIGIDYGIKGITAYEKLIHLPDGLCVIDKCYNYSGADRVKTDSELVDDLLEFIGDDNISKVFIDPSASSFIAEIKTRHPRFRVEEANNSVLAGIKTVTNGFESGKLVIQDNESTTPLLDELSIYEWKLGVEDKPVKENDHHCDAVRYGYYSRKLTKKRIIRSLPQWI